MMKAADSKDEDPINIEKVLFAADVKRDFCQALVDDYGVPAVATYFDLNKKYTTLLESVSTISVTPQVGSPSLRAVPREAIQSFTVLLKLQ